MYSPLNSVRVTRPRAACTRAGGNAAKPKPAAWGSPASPPWPRGWCGRRAPPTASTLGIRRRRGGGGEGRECGGPRKRWRKKPDFCRYAAKSPSGDEASFRQGPSGPKQQNRQHPVRHEPVSPAHFPCLERTQERKHVRRFDAGGAAHPPSWARAPAPSWPGR